MSSDAAPETWTPLSAIERRVLGVLLEKAKTTPDTYPLSLNALTTGCNQKSNRDPVMSVSDEQVEDSAIDLQKKGLVTRITGGRVERFRHNMYEVWKVSKVELAVLAELFLRGPQTEGELRQHAARMEPIESLDELRDVLRPLQQRGLIFWIGAEGRRGSQIAHGFMASYERDRLIKAGPREVDLPPPSAPAPVAEPVPSRLEAELRETREALSAVQAKVTSMEAQLQDLATQLAGLKSALGA